MIMYRKINKKKILYVEINLNLFDRISFFFFRVRSFACRLVFIFLVAHCIVMEKNANAKDLDFFVRVIIIVSRIRKRNIYATRCSYFEEMIVSEVKRKKIKNARYL